MRARTDAELAYERLRDLIIRNELQAGRPLVEADLMRRIGIGRTPLRDALHRLAHEGLVEILPRRGTFVSEVTLSSLQEILEVAWPVEELVARLAVERCTPDDLSELEQLIDRQACVPDEIGATEERGATIDVDVELQRLLLKIAHNSYLADVYRRCWDAALRMRYVTGCTREPHGQQRRFLREVADALAARDEERLGEALRGHLVAFREQVAAGLFGRNDRSARAS